MRTSSTCLLTLALLLPAAGVQAQAQAFPNKPVRIIIGAAAGGAIDSVARIMSEGLTALWGQAVVIDNRPGASEMIGASAVAKSAPDGYTLLMASSNPFTINPSVFDKLPYDPAKSFASVALISTNPMAIVSNPKAPFGTLPDLVKYGLAHPGELSWSTPGLATMNHITGEWLSYETKMKTVHVPYKGGPPAVNAVISGEVPYGIVSLVQALPFAKAGNVKILAVTSEKRSQLAPDVPTVAELSVPGFDSTVLAVLVAPAGTPDDVIARINSDVNKVLAKPDLREKFATLGAEPMPSQPAELERAVAKIRDKVASIVKRAGIKAE